MSDDNTELAPLYEWRAALADSDLSSSARLVGHILSTYMNARTNSCFPSQTRIGHDANLSKNTVIRGLDELERTGWLAVKRGGSKPGGKRLPNVYTTVVPNTLDRFSSGTGSVAAPVQSLTTTGATMGPRPVQPARHNSPMNSPMNSDDPSTCLECGSRRPFDIIVGSFGECPICAQSEVTA